MNNIKNEIESNRAKVDVNTNELEKRERNLDKVKEKICKQDLKIKELEKNNKKLEDKVVNAAKRLENSKAVFDREVEALEESLHGDTRTKSEIELELSRLKAELNRLQRENLSNNFERCAENFKSKSLEANSQMETNELVESETTENMDVIYKSLKL